MAKLLSGAGYNSFCHLIKMYVLEILKKYMESVDHILVSWVLSSSKRTKGCLSYVSEHLGAKINQDCMMIYAKKTSGIQTNKRVSNKGCRFSS